MAIDNCINPRHTTRNLYFDPARHTTSTRFMLMSAASSFAWVPLVIVLIYTAATTMIPDPYAIGATLPLYIVHRVLTPILFASWNRKSRQVTGIPSRIGWAFFNTVLMTELAQPLFFLRYVYVPWRTTQARLDTRHATSFAALQPA